MAALIVKFRSSRQRRAINLFNVITWQCSDETQIHEISIASPTHGQTRVNSQSMNPHNIWVIPNYRSQKLNYHGPLLC